MNLYTETIEEKEKVLVVSKKNYLFLSLIKEELRKHGCEIFFSSRLPKNTHSFRYCFFINENGSQIPTADHQIKVFIFVDQSKQASALLQKTHNQSGNKIKIIEINGNDIRKEHIDRILWFTFSQTKEKFFKFSVARIKPKHKTYHINYRHFYSFITPKRLILAALSAMLALHLAFIPFLIYSSFLIYKSYDSIKTENIQASEKWTQESAKAFYIAKKLYNYVKPTYLLFSLALLPDTIVDLNERSINIFKHAIDSFKNSQEIITALLKKDKSLEEKSYLNLRFESLKNQLASIEDDLSIVGNKLPSPINKKIKPKLTEGLDSIAKIRKLLNHTDEILGKNTEKKYLIFFANNMELRPGGGFLGSFGIVKVKDFTVEDIQINDVYDADGQLIAHVEPPLPVKKYLNIPHLFLRDSNVSPDFYENYTSAKFFLDKEINQNDFSGAVLITASGIENLLEAFGNIYIPDFNEYINQKNFYLKTQIHVEDNFFPGSIQKKSFLSSLAKQLIINLETASSKKLALSVKKSLDEKQIVVYLDEPVTQELIDSFYWSGRIIEPRCSASISNCIVDYIFPYDMNVGLNKVNYFIKRQLSIKTSIEGSGLIQNQLSIRFKNESATDVFPGGIYKNYFQLLLPLNSVIKQITKDGTLVEDFQEKDDRLKTLSFYLEIPPQTTSEIKINYQLNQSLLKGRGIYQLIVQKQIGSSNNDFSFEMHLPKNVSIVNQNFSPLVKEREIVYNTVLSADKIFFIELTRE